MKNTIKIFTALVLAFALILSFAGCGEKKELMTSASKKVTVEEEAKIAVQELLDALKSADAETAKKFLTASETATELESVLSSGQFMELLFASLDYKIISAEKVDEDTVHVSVDITARDMKPVMQAAIEKLIAYALEANFAQTQPSEAEYTEKMVEIYAQAMSDAELTTVTNTVSVVVNKVEGAWVVMPEAEFADAVFGGLQSAVEELVSDMGMMQ